MSKQTFEFEIEQTKTIRVTADEMDLGQWAVDGGVEPEDVAEEIALEAFNTGTHVDADISVMRSDYQVHTWKEVSAEDKDADQ